MAKYRRPPNLAASIGAVSMSCGGFAVVIRPPASSSRQIPAQTSHSQQPCSSQSIGRRRIFLQRQLTASQHMSKEPIAQYARSRVADPRLRTPWTMPPLPSRPSSSLAMLTKLSTFRCRFPSRMSRRSLPHSHEKMQPFGALFGSGGMGFRSKGKR
jgi:hypothetical protein